MRTKRKLRGGLLKEMLTPPLTGKEIELKREQDRIAAASKTKKDSLKTLIAEEDKCSKKDAEDLDALIADPANAEFSKIIQNIKDDALYPSLYKLTIANFIKSGWDERKVKNDQDLIVEAMDQPCNKLFNTEMALSQLQNQINSMKKNEEKIDKKEIRERMDLTINTSLQIISLGILNGFRGEADVTTTNDSDLFVKDIITLRGAITFNSCDKHLTAESFNKFSEKDRKTIIGSYNEKGIKIPDGYVVPAAGGKRRRTKRKALRKYASTRSRAKRGP